VTAPQTATLSDFLLACIAEDEAVARAVPDDTDPKSAASVFSSLSEPTGTVEMQPAHVLATCAAHRRIVERCGPYLDPFSLTTERACTAEAELADDTLRTLATAYADRPGFREEWL
jgi:hypothetical protein